MSCHARSTVAVLAATLIGLLLVAAAPPAGAIARTSAAHPYSDPVWYPLRVSARLDCVKNNPGCTAPHPNWMMDMVPDGQGQRTSRAGVYAMGAGILHIGNAHGARCGKENSYGTWVWIDHGAGQLSRYGHLSAIAGRTGDRVAAGQRIGTVGTTGKIRNCHISYVNFSVQHNGLQTSHGVEIRTLRACTGSPSRAQTWPQAVRSRYPRWERVPRGTTFPASSSACIPSSTPQTAARPGAPSVAVSGKRALRVSWARPAASKRVKTVMVQLALWHPSTHAWDRANHVRYVAIPVSRSGVRITGLGSKRLYRVRVSFHNSWGWSATSAWRKRTLR